MKHGSLCLMVVTSFVLMLASCIKEEDEVNNDKIMVKSHEILSYHYEEYEGNRNYTLVVPSKIYVKGGAPELHSNNYKFTIAEGSKLPEGIHLDESNGVFSKSDGTIDTAQYIQEFMIEVTDGNQKTLQKVTLKNTHINEGARMILPVMQFNSPETRLVRKYGSNLLAYH